ncbi:hypothetical protein SAY86_008994 [Trapa natans]|uniref:Uncharacterized protein n=1 Tax=Trapa natans TaxID=22666 RepID=A0AAN7KAG9_TRANT|nr:hypothetical protein SAY86_008994 [Trapa natans]
MAHCYCIKQVSPTFALVVGPDSSASSCTDTVEGITPASDLPLLPGLDTVHAHLLHGPGEGLEEGALVGREPVHERLRPLVGRHDLVRGQEPHPPLEVQVVHVVELVWGHHVVEGRHGGVLGVVGAELLEPFGVLGVVGRVGVGLIAVVVEAVAELLAVGESDGVGARQGHHVAHVEPLLLEHGYDIVEGGGRLGQVVLHLGRVGGEPVFPAQGDIVEGTANHGYEIPGGHGEDVAAGDSAGALELEGGLGLDDQVEAVSWEGEVDVRIALGLVEGVGGDEDGAVAAVDHAIVEEEAEGGRGGGGVGDLLVDDHPADDVVEAGARLGIVVGCELVRRRLLGLR